MSYGGVSRPVVLEQLADVYIKGIQITPLWKDGGWKAQVSLTVKSIADHSCCYGVYIWQFCDVRVSEEWFGGRPRTMNNKGVVDEYRRRKLCYDRVKQIFETYDNYWN